MFRLLAIAAVVVAFGATLYYSGDALDAWESPEPAAKASQAPVPGSKKRAKSTHRSRKANEATPRKASWISKLDGLCRRGQAETESIRPPSGPQDSARFFGQFARMNTRWNRKAAVLLQGSAGRSKQEVKQLLRLFDQEETLVQSMVTASRRGQYSRLGRIAESLLGIAKSENRLLARLGAIDCTVSPDVFRL